MPILLKNGMSLQVPKATARRVPVPRKRKRSASIASLTVSKKRLMTRCSKRAGKNSNKREKFFDLCSSGSRHRLGRGQTSPLSFEPETCWAPSYAFSSNQRLHQQSLCGSRTRRLRRTIDAGRQPHEMAYCPYHMVFRNVYP